VVIKVVCFRKETWTSEGRYTVWAAIWMWAQSLGWLCIDDLVEIQEPLWE
jgi:hypothetical protein